MEDLAALSGIPVGVFGAVIGFYALIIVLIIAGMWKVFTKAGQPGWACLVPIYNLYILTKIIEKPGYWVLLMMIPYVNLIFMTWTYNLRIKQYSLWGKHLSSINFS